MTTQNSNKKIFLGCLYAIGSEIIYGVSYLFSKDITADISPIYLEGWRFFVAFIAICICSKIGIIKLNLKGRNIKPLIIVGILNPLLYFTGETFGIMLTTASEGGVALGCSPIVAVIASTLILKKKPTKNQLIGIFFTTIGIILTVITLKTSANFSAVGYLMLLLATVSYALYEVYVEKAASFSSHEITFVMLASGAIVFTLISIIKASIEGNLSMLVSLPFANTKFLLVVLYQGICCSVLSLFLFNKAITIIGANRAATFIGVETVVSILCGVIFLKESFDTFQIIGSILILSGVYVANSLTSAASSSGH